MRHWTQVPTGPAGRREDELGGSPARTAKASPFPPPPAPGLAASLSVQPSGHPDTHPNRAREIDPRRGEQLLQPLERQPGKGKQGQLHISPSPQWPGTACSQMGLNREERGPRDPAPAPLPLPVRHRASQETGHTLVTSPNLGRSALCPEPPSSPRSPPTPVNSLSSNRKNTGRGWGGGGQALARRDRVDGQQAPELEVLDHRELLQALQGGGSRQER